MKGHIQFLGAAGNVTGSRHLVDLDGFRFLVDCGLHQERQHKDRDYQPFPVPPESIDAVILTHAHLDHCGYLPRLVREGFRGKVYCTQITAEIARVVLHDAAYLLAEDARFKRKRHQREGRETPHDYQPLYTAEDVDQALQLIEAVSWDEEVRLADRVTATFRTAGHILGSAFVLVAWGDEVDRRTLLFSGDVGRFDKPILDDPVSFPQADYVVVESTYGDREHSVEGDLADRLADVINNTYRRGGNIVIPSFAIERAQEVLYHLSELMRAKKIPRLLVFLDSPMAVRVTEIFRRHPERYDAEMRALLRTGQSPFDLPELTPCLTRQQSMAINSVRGTAIIIAGSGMCTGGRVKHHLAFNIGRAASTVLFVGYQAEGTLGRQIVDGATVVRIHGNEYPVRAHIESLQGFSAHADRGELTRWLQGLQRPPRRLFVVHGEASAAKAFASHLTSELGWPITVPEYKNKVALD